MTHETKALLVPRMERLPWRQLIIALGFSTGLLSHGMAEETSSSRTSEQAIGAVSSEPQSGGGLKYRVGFLGIPSSVKQFEMLRPMEWNRENVQRLISLGFNTVQLNVAWGRRPGDEPLNIEDVVELTPAETADYPQPVALRSGPKPEQRESRRRELKHRIDLCRSMGLRTIFHFGAPYNAHNRYGDAPPNCISDPKVTERYELLIDHFAREFAGVDDLLLYTYDQDAWICSEFGPCPRCLGRPLHERITPFIERLAKRWRRHNSDGLLWWEPWELSAGQCLEAAATVNTEGFGLALHCNVAEVMTTIAADRWFRNMAAVAQSRGIPVIAEFVLGASSEELEPFLHLSHPLATLRGVRTLAEVPGVVGLKEYYGMAPDLHDPNLSATALYMRDPSITEEQVLERLAASYGARAGGMKDFWKKTSLGMELFPWDTSWYLHNLGRSVTTHSLSAAMLRGQQAHTPSWESTRKAIFMKTDDAQPDPWMLEDVELRCRRAAAEWTSALEHGERILHDVSPGMAPVLRANLTDLSKLIRRALTYELHLRQTNLARCMRTANEKDKAIPERMVAEMRSLLQQDMENTRAEGGDWPEMSKAIALLERDPAAFLNDYFTEKPDKRSQGIYSMTSR